MLGAHIMFSAEVRCSHGNHGIAIEVGSLTPPQGQLRFDADGSGTVSVSGRLDMEIESQDGRVPPMRLVTSPGVKSIESFEISIRTLPAALLGAR